VRFTVVPRALWNNLTEPTLHVGPLTQKKFALIEMQAQILDSVAAMMAGRFTTRRLRHYGGCLLVRWCCLVRRLLRYWVWVAQWDVLLLVSGVVVVDLTTTIAVDSIFEERRTDFYMVMKISHGVPCMTIGAFLRRLSIVMGRIMTLDRKGDVQTAVVVVVTRQLKLDEPVLSKAPGIASDVEVV
jgi:hypothetical protein